MAPIGPEAEIDGLSARAIRAAIQSRIRQAGIRMLTPEQQRRMLRRPCLRVNVATSKLDTGEDLYCIRVEVTQWVASLGNPKVIVGAAIPFPAQTWSAAGVFGIAPADQVSQDVLRAMGAMIGEFIDAYYKANPSETAIRARRGRRSR